MSTVMQGRYAASTDQPVVVFLIGMRINRLLAVASWFPISMLMSPMLGELYRHKELGFLGGEFLFSWKGITLLQYWKSYEHLEQYAKGDLHMKAWRTFYEKAGKTDSVGIWHETYVLEPGQFESIYVNMPVMGLAKATSHIPIMEYNATARKRMKRDWSSE